MKSILTILFLIFLTSSVSANPFYDPNAETVVYDTSYNIALRNKLEADFDKKYIKSVVKDKDGNITTTYSYPDDAYYKEVLEPYVLNKKPDNYKIYKIIKN